VQKDNSLDLCRTFFKNLKPEYVKESLEKVFELNKDEYMVDRLYRVYHRSYKMYYGHNDRTAAYLGLMFAPLGYIPVEDTKQENLEAELLAQLEYWEFDTIFQRTIKEAFACKWSQERNKEDLWFQDQKTILAAYYAAREVSTASLQSLDDMCNSKKGVLWQTGILSHHDALFLETWESVGLILRYSFRDPVKEKILSTARANLE